MSNVNLNGSSWNAKTGNIVFASDREPHDEIYMIAANGKNGGEIRITNRADFMGYEPSFSPDGEWIVFESHPLDNEGNGAITKCQVDGTGKKFVPLTDPTSDCRQPVWSPNGDSILYQKYEQQHWNIWIMKADGTEPHRVTTGIGSKTDASFSPDGKWIVYSSDGQGELKFANIYSSSINGGKPTRITNFNGYDGAPN